MNSLELDALQLPLSNSARVLYAIYLRPKTSATRNTVVIDYKEIMALLNTKKDSFQLGRQINTLIKELNQVGLVALDPNDDIAKSLHQKSLSLPLIVVKHLSESGDDPKKQTEYNHNNEFQTMTMQWRPPMALFEQICQLVGVIDKGYSTDELGEFIAYWLGYPEKTFSAYQWTQKFVLNIKLRRQRFPIDQQQTKVGHQWVTPQASIEIDDNVRQLVEKYSEQK